jgi:cation:H+ antiporter
MDVIYAVIFLSTGLVVLWKSADVLVDGAVGIARRLGIRPLIIGLTIVAMGTSAPEVAASIAAALRGAADVAVGNVYGSNIANLALVGGLSAMIAPIVVGGKMLRREIPVMVGVALLLWPALFDKSLSRPEGFLLLAIFAGLISAAVYLAKKENQNSKREEFREIVTEVKQLSSQKSIVFIVLGLAGLALGAELTVRGAVVIGEKIGMSEAVIGLTIVAIGTSLPELVTCVVAAVKGHNDISIGNLVGSNVFNTLLVTGTAGVVRPFDITARLAGGIDYWIMIGVSVAFALIALLGKCVIGRIGGAVLFCGYVAYLVYLLCF